MAIITVRLIVAEDGTVSTAMPLPAGEHRAVITLAEPERRYTGKPFTMEDFPVHSESWDDSISLRREDLYDAEGRLR